MGSKWNKVKIALGMNLCVYAPRNHILDNDDEGDSLPPARPPERRSNATLLSAEVEGTSASAPLPLGLSRLKLSRSFSRSSSKRTCSICLASMRRGDGHAIFTAECSHSFHFHCVASNVKHGNQTCPVCRAKWKEIPFQSPSLDPPFETTRVNPVVPHRNDALTPGNLQLPPRRNSRRLVAPLFHSPEPSFFNDDELLDIQTDSSSAEDCVDRSKVMIKTYTEVQAVAGSNTSDDFTILLNLKAPSNFGETPTGNHANLNLISQTPRAPVDLVTVLDISGSMAGTKLALLKRAMGFLIQNLGPNDRLAVIAFSSNASRLFPLLRMSETGKQLALQAVNSLIANGGTNIAEGLRKGAKIMEDRRQKNPVSSIILLSDGQDTYSVSNAGGNQNRPGYQLLVPLSAHTENSSGVKIPVHAFGFGTDHDASRMHSLSESSGGTFSFIETEGMIQDAFAQCIGGLLSVVVKNLQLSIECVHPRVQIRNLKAGSYPNLVMSDQRTGSIDVGDLYADEERDFLVSVNVPDELSSNETTLLKVRCIYNDPLRKATVNLESGDIRITRSEEAGQEETSIKVDRQRNRLRVADAMAQARTVAENGDLALAISTLENCRRALSETVSAKSQDRLWIALDAELKEMQERMASRHVYETSGRAYILSGLSSHSWQRATARGDSTDLSSLIQAYQTPSMVDMLTRSHATFSQPRPR